MTEAQFHRNNRYWYNKEREPTEAKLLLLTEPCPECHGTGRYVHGDECSYAKDEGPCDCAGEPMDFCDVCGGKKRFRVTDVRVTRFTYPLACSL